MNKASEMNYKYDFENDSGSSYLVLKVDSGAKLLNHQTEIICQNPSTAFVPFHIWRKDETINIYYDITSKISLSRYLERKKLTREELLDLLRNLTNSLMQYSNYLLQLSGFMVHSDFIFINPATVEVSLIYIPIPQEKDAIELYKSFLKDLLVNSVCIDDNAKDNYLQRILNYLRSDAFNLNSFGRLIAELRMAEGATEPICKAAETSKELSLKKESNVSKLKDTFEMKDNINKCKASHKYLLRVAAVQILTILAAAIVCLLLAVQKTCDWISIGGVLLIASAADVLAVRWMVHKSEKQSSTVEAVMKIENKRRQSKSRDVNKDTPPPCKEHNFCSSYSTPEAAKAFDTILISDVPQETRPYLESVGTSAIERVTLNKNKFVIGRLSSMVDHIVKGSTIGKLHAEITEKGGIYCIRDLNSRNGTYVNDMRIPSNKEFEIRNNDRIKLSDIEYVFRQ